MSRAAVVDATGLILGRMASYVAKRLLSGESVIIVNAERAVISGKKGMIVRKRKEFLGVGGYRRGPLHPRRADGIVRRVIRGMLPYRKPRGRAAFRRLRVYVGVPREFGKRELETIEDAKADRLRCKFITVGELAREIG
ncbi:TPA: 50S ribosomal protein L13 [Candidatus Bathyarchaeota archaeon]|nr:50S ribosomal protein L13 [Candidatus Bathyarchaeota archaeon]